MTANILDIAGLTDIGKKRKRNEDSFRIEPVDHWTLCIVADGMGGHTGGDTASRLAVEGSVEGFTATDGELDRRLIAAVEQANLRVWREAERDSKLMGMGTTLVCLAIAETRYQIAHVGDSRAYLVSADEVRQLTTDHSWVGEQVAIGAMTAEEAAKHPFRGAITRCVGCQPTVEADISPVLTLDPGAALVLCSDGLTNHVPDEEIRDIAVSMSSGNAAEKLIQLANERGGIDNITVVIVRAPDKASA